MSERKTLPTHLNRAPVAEAIVPKLPKKNILLALLAKGKKENIMQYLKTGDLPSKPTELQILNALYNGTEYSYGPEGNRGVETVTPIPDEIEEVWNSFTDDEKKVFDTKAPKASISEVKKNMYTKTVQDLKKAGLTLEAISNVESISSILSPEEIEAAFNA